MSLMLNEDIIEFIYNNELFGNQVTDIMTLFEKRHTAKIISIYDKVAIYKFSEDIKGNLYIFKKIINDFISLIKYLNGIKKENKGNDIKEETKIYELFDKLKDIFSGEFIKMFEKNDGLTIDKTTVIFSYYLKLIYEDVKNEIKKYQKDLEDNSKEMINNYYKKELPLITKKDFSSAIRVFMTLVLFLEEDKENKIQSNRNNIVNYLKSSDLWNKDIYNNDDFNKNLNELKTFNIQINQIIYLYEFLCKDIELNFNDEVKKQIEKEEKEQNNNIQNTTELGHGPENNANNGTGEEEENEEDEDPFHVNEDDENEDDREN